MWHMRGGAKIHWATWNGEWEPVSHSRHFKLAMRLAGDCRNHKASMNNCSLHLSLLLHNYTMHLSNARSNLLELLVIRYNTCRHLNKYVSYRVIEQKIYLNGWFDRGKLIVKVWKNLACISLEILEWPWGIYVIWCGRSGQSNITGGRYGN